MTDTITIDARITLAPDIVEAVWEAGYVDGVPAAWANVTSLGTGYAMVEYDPNGEPETVRWDPYEASHAIAALLGSSPGLGRGQYRPGSDVDRVRRALLMAVVADDPDMAENLDPYEVDIIRQYGAFGRVVFG